MPGMDGTGPFGGMQAGWNGCRRRQPNGVGMGMGMGFRRGAGGAGRGMGRGLRAGLRAFGPGPGGSRPITGWGPVAPPADSRGRGRINRDR